MSSFWKGFIATSAGILAGSGAEAAFGQFGIPTAAVVSMMTISVLESLF